MPEGLEAEIWRTAIKPLIGRTVDDVWFDDRVVDPGVTALTGQTIDSVSRRGKVIQIDVGGDLVGLHFGMTGRVVVDGDAAIDALEYSSSKDRPEWDTLRLFTRPDEIDAVHPVDAVPALRINDPRRLGRVSLDADLSALGVDIFDVTIDTLSAALSRRRAAIKTTLLDQSVVAGLGNLCADEVLWWAGIDPHRPVDGLTGDELQAVVTAMQQRLPVMLAAGGSTTGSLDPARRAALGPCPRDGAPLDRSTIGGRTAVWCPTHQR